jgi:hypothetical protein
VPGVNPAADAYLVNYLKRLDARLAALETQPALNNSAITNGQLTVFDGSNDALVITGLQPKYGTYGTYYYDTSGNLLVAIGQLPDGTYGTQVQNSAGVLFFKMSTATGLTAPEMVGVTVDSTTPKVVTSGTFVNTWRVVLGQIVSPGVEVVMPLTTDVGTTAEVRLSVGGFTTSAFALTSGWSAQNFIRWLHGVALTAGPLQIDLQARRTGGAGNVNVYAPAGWSRDPNLADAHPACTSAGTFI